MRTQILAMATMAALLGAAATPAHAAGQQSAAGAAGAAKASPPAAQKASPPAQRSFTGTWVSEPDRTPLTSDLQISIWGAGAESVRTVELAVRPSGEGTLKVTTKIVDAKGKTVPASTSVEEATVMLAGAGESSGVRTEYPVQVLTAQRRYPDDPKDKWPIEGLKVKLATIEGEADTIELRYDTPEGKGSFWATLAHPGRGGSRRSSR